MYTMDVMGTTAVFRPGSMLGGICSEGLAVEHQLAASGRMNWAPPSSLTSVSFSLEMTEANKHGSLYTQSDFLFFLY